VSRLQHLSGTLPENGLRLCLDTEQSHVSLVSSLEMVEVHRPIVNGVFIKFFLRLLLLSKASKAVLMQSHNTVYEKEILSPFTSSNNQKVESEYDSSICSYRTKSL